MTQYETAFLISPNLEEEETEKVITQMADVISEKKGKMINEDRWGKRRLAYPIKKFEEAFYVFFHYEGDPEIPLELERRFKQTEEVLRYLTMKKTQKENVRRKKKTVPTEQERAVPPKEKVPETEVAETEALDKKGEEKTQAVKKEEAVAAEEADKKEEVTKKEETVEKKEDAEEKEKVEEGETAENKEDAQKDVVPPEEGKEK